MLKDVLDMLPDGGAIVVLSGGMDSTIAMRLCVERYGRENVRALSFYYGQKQFAELDCAVKSTNYLGVKHKILNLAVLGEISEGFSANVDKNIEMPTIKDVLGDPRPKTYVPNRNMILMSFAAAVAETANIPNIFMGLQVHDEYGYHDTTQRFVDKINDVLSENRIIKIKVQAPFARLSKFDELQLLKEMDDLPILEHTLTCYNPVEITDGKFFAACGECPSCSERIANFIKFGVIDPMPYVIQIDWEKHGCVPLLPALTKTS